MLVYRFWARIARIKFWFYFRTARGKADRRGESREPN
jgi:hypothetical protein